MTSSKAESDPDNQKKAMSVWPDVHHISTQLDQPNTFWRSAFCPEEWDTLLALIAHTDENHKGHLFRFECGSCKFQAGGPRLLRENQARAHRTNIVATTTPMAVKQGTRGASQAIQLQEPQPATHEAPEAPVVRNERGITSISSTGQCSDPNEFRLGDPCNPHCQRARTFCTTPKWTNNLGSLACIFS